MQERESPSPAREVSKASGGRPRPSPPVDVIRWEPSHPSLLREYIEVLLVIAVVTAIAWFVPVDYRVFGDLYLLAVIVLCLRVSQWPIFFASVLSVLAWNFCIVAPRMAFSRLSLQDGMFLGTYFIVALVAGQLTARLRAKELQERQRKQHATAMFYLTRALSSARTLDEAIEVALRQADALFGVPTALALPGEGGRLVSHPASLFHLDDRELASVMAICRGREGDAPDVIVQTDGRHLHLAVRRGQAVTGVFSIQWPRDEGNVPLRYRKLMEAFVGQIGLLVEREQFRAAGERETLLAESARMHRTLLDSVSHELKTPVAVLRSAAEGLAREKGARREILAQEILTAARRLDHLVANLLDQTRLEAGRINLRIDWCDVYDLIGAARRSVGESLARRPFTINVPPDMPLFMADSVLMEHVLSNLLLNAVHHTPPGTAITVSAGVEVRDNAAPGRQDKDEGDSRVFITVADRGPGFTPEVRERLFQKFERGTRARAGGLGLGLSIVRGFMLAQGGDVVADEQPGGGARFTIYLPHKVHESVPLE